MKYLFIKGTVYLLNCITTKMFIYYKHLYADAYTIIIICLINHSSYYILLCDQRCFNYKTYYTNTKIEFQCFEMNYVYLISNYGRYLHI